MKPGGQRRKGHAWEREVARMFREVMPGCDAKRGWQSRGGGKEEADVMIPIYHVECKHGKKPNYRAAYAQAVDDNKEKVPIAVCKDDRKQPVVIISLEDFLKMAGALWEQTCQTSESST